MSSPSALERDGRAQPNEEARRVRPRAGGRRALFALTALAILAAALLSLDACTSGPLPPSEAPASEASAATPAATPAADSGAIQPEVRLEEGTAEATIQGETASVEDRPVDTGSSAAPPLAQEPAALEPAIAHNATAPGAALEGEGGAEPNAIEPEIASTEAARSEPNARSEEEKAGEESRAAQPPSSEASEGEATLDAAATASSLSESAATEASPAELGKATAIPDGASKGALETAPERSYPTAPAPLSPWVVAGSRLSRAKGEIGYLETALSDYWRTVLANGATVAIKRQAGRKRAAARISYAPDARAIEGWEPGIAALALAAAAKAPTGAKPGAVERAILESGASLQILRELDDSLTIELLCPADQAAALLELLGKSLASPLFAQEDFEKVLRESRVEERRESGDFHARADAELKSRLRGDGSSLASAGRSPEALALASATRESALRFWEERFGAECLSIVVVGDFEPDRLVRLVSSSFGAIPKRKEGRVEAAISASDARAHERKAAVSSWLETLPLAAMRGSVMLRADFEAPRPSSEDYPAMTVAVAALDDLLRARLSGASVMPTAAARPDAAVKPDEGIHASVSLSMDSSTVITVYRVGSPAEAKSAVEAAIRDLAGGMAIDPSSSGVALAALEKSLESYKARALTSAYSRVSDAAGIAKRIARDLASGGDGTAFFRLSGRIAATRAEDVVRAARRWLASERSAWVALEDPELMPTAVE